LLNLFCLFQKVEHRGVFLLPNAQIKELNFVAKIQATNGNFISDFGDAILKCDWTDKEISLGDCEVDEANEFKLPLIVCASQKTVYTFTVTNVHGYVLYYFYFSFI
jgi:hypothetical protein